MYGDRVNKKNLAVLFFFLFFFCVFFPKGTEVFFFFNKTRQKPGNLVKKGRIQSKDSCTLWTQCPSLSPIWAPSEPNLSPIWAYGPHEPQYEAQHDIQSTPHATWTPKPLRRYTARVKEKKSTQTPTYKTWKKRKSGYNTTLFPGGPPPQYWAGSTSFNFGVRMGSGALNVIWSYPST